MISIDLNLNVIDLFCGAGGFSYGFLKAGYNVILGVDNKEHKLHVYRKNIKPQKILNKDITKLTANNIIKEIDYKKINVIIGSPPCKDYSTCIPKKKEDNFLSSFRKGLVYHFYRLTVILKPSWFVLENIPNFFQTLDGEFIIELFKIHGYTVKLFTLNAADFGVPQLRKRSFLIGNINGKEIEFKPTVDKYITLEEAIKDLEFVDNNDYKELVKLKQENMNDYQKIVHSDNHIVKNHILTNHTFETIDKISKLKQGERDKKNSNYYRCHYDKPSHTITSRYDTPSGQSASIHPSLNRSFTAREAARIQSFSDDFIFEGTKDQIKEQIGEAVPPLLSQEIAKKIKEEILKEYKKDV